MTKPAVQETQFDFPVSMMPDRILIVRMSAMGDVIHAMPAVAALRKTKPDLKIGWLIEERWAELLCARSAPRLSERSDAKPLADWVHATNFASWRKGLQSSASWHEIRKCTQEVRTSHYEVALDLQGTMRSAYAAYLSSAASRIGSAQPREGPARLLYTRSIQPHGEHVVEQALSLAAAVAGGELSLVEPPFPVDPEAETWAQRLHEEVGGKPLAIVNPGAGWGTKCWPARSFGSVAQALAEGGMAVLINHGPGEEGLAQAVHEASGGTASPMKCSVGELIAITRRASLFIGGDTGPMHLAAALHAPVVALFGPTRPERNGPFGTRSVVLQNPKSVRSTSHTDQPDAGLLAIAPATVIDAAYRLIRGQST